MSRRLLSEQEESSKEIINVAIVKSIAQSPLTLDELKNIEHVDIATLIVEHELSYPEADRVVNWVKNEVYRHNAQDVSYGGSGDTDLVMESTTRPHTLRGIIQEEIDNIFKKR